MNLKILSAGFLVSAAALLPLSSPASEMRTEVRIVSYADLNLDHPEGVETLYRRVRGAARSACDAMPDLDPYLRNQSRDCVRRALAEAVTQVEELAARHDGRQQKQRLVQR